MSSGRTRISRNSIIHCRHKDFETNGKLCDVFYELADRNINFKDNYKPYFATLDKKTLMPKQEINGYKNPGGTVTKGTIRNMNNKNVDENPSMRRYYTYYTGTGSRRVRRPTDVDVEHERLLLKKFMSKSEDEETKDDDQTTGNQNDVTKSLKSNIIRRNKARTSLDHQLHLETRKIGCEFEFSYTLPRFLCFRNKETSSAGNVDEINTTPTPKKEAPRTSVVNDEIFQTSDIEVFHGSIADTENPLKIKTCQRLGDESTINTKSKRNYLKNNNNQQEKVLNKLYKSKNIDNTKKVKIGTTSITQSKFFDETHDSNKNKMSKRVDDAITFNRAITAPINGTIDEHKTIKDIFDLKQFLYCKKSDQLHILYHNLNYKVLNSLTNINYKPSKTCVLDEDIRDVNRNVKTKKVKWSPYNREGSNSTTSLNINKNYDLQNESINKVKMSNSKDKYELKFSNSEMLNVRNNTENLTLISEAFCNAFQGENKLHNSGTPSNASLKKLPTKSNFGIKRSKISINCNPSSNTYMALIGNTNIDSNKTDKDESLTFDFSKQDLIFNTEDSAYLQLFVQVSEVYYRLNDLEQRIRKVINDLNIEEMLNEPNNGKTDDKNLTANTSTCCCKNHCLAVDLKSACSESCENCLKDHVDVQNNVYNLCGEDNRSTVAKIMDFIGSILGVPNYECCCDCCENRNNLCSNCNCE